MGTAPIGEKSLEAIAPRGKRQGGASSGEGLSDGRGADRAAAGFISDGDATPPAGRPKESAMESEGLKGAFGSWR